MHVVICGGGVIGASIAYFLSGRGVKATVIERTGLACAASGKAGGFLARDWCDGTPLAPLARRSFALHAELNARLADDWGYRLLDTYGGVAGFRGLRRGHHLDWLSARVTISQQIGTYENTAQVHPEHFTTAMMCAAVAQGAELRLGCVTGIVKRGDRTAGVIVDGETIDADVVVVAMGPWSLLAAQWMQLPAVFGLKGHSLVIDGCAAIPAQAVFLEYGEPNGEVLTPELFPRLDGSVYVCAISSEAPLPLDPAHIVPDPGAIKRLEALCASVSPVLAGASIAARQACYRPITADGLPLIGRVPGLSGAYIATGHSVWGILNAPATGEAMAELIVDGAAGTTDLRPFDPARLPPLEPARLSRRTVDGS